MNKHPKLELTWIGKETRPQLEPRILVEDPGKSYHAAFRVAGWDGDGSRGGAYEAHVTRGFRTLRANNYSAAADEDTRDFRTTIPEGQRNRIGTMVFGGFGKCLYPIQKFESDPERRFAVILENDADVLKWFKPATDHAKENGGKPWRYLLIPHDQIQDQMSLAGLAARHEITLA